MPYFISVLANKFVLFNNKVNTHTVNRKSHKLHLSTNVFLDKLGLLSVLQHQMHSE